MKKETTHMYIYKAELLRLKKLAEKEDRTLRSMLAKVLDHWENTHA